MEGVEQHVKESDSTASPTACVFFRNFANGPLESSRVSSKTKRLFSDITSKHNRDVAARSPKRAKRAERSCDEFVKSAEADSPGKTATEEEIVCLLADRLSTLLGKKNSKKIIQGLLTDGGLSKRLAKFDVTQLGNLIDLLVKVLFEARGADERVTRLQFYSSIQKELGWKVKVAKSHIYSTFKRMVEAAVRREAKELLLVTQNDNSSEFVAGASSSLKEETKQEKEARIWLSRSRFKCLLRAVIDGEVDAKDLVSCPRLIKCALNWLSSSS